MGELISRVTPKMAGDARALGRLKTKWSALVGPAVAAHSEPSSIREGILRIRVDSSAWATEVRYLGGQILDLVRSDLGDSGPSEVIVWIGEGSRDPANSTPRSSTERLEPMRARAAEEASEESLEGALSRARAAWIRRRARGRPMPPT